MATASVGCLEASVPQGWHLAHETPAPDSISAVPFALSAIDAARPFRRQACEQSPCWSKLATAPRPCVAATRQTLQSTSIGQGQGAIRGRAHARRNWPWIMWRCPFIPCLGSDAAAIRIPTRFAERFSTADVAGGAEWRPRLQRLLFHRKCHPWDFCGFASDKPENSGLEHVTFAKGRGEEGAPEWPDKSCH
jgi:hypothetical protein